MINMIMYDPELAQATLAVLAKIMPEQSPHTSAEGTCSNGASPSCTQNAEICTHDDDHVLEINMAGALA